MLILWITCCVKLFELWLFICGLLISCCLLLFEWATDCGVYWRLFAFDGWCVFTCLGVGLRVGFAYCVCGGWLVGLLLFVFVFCLLLLVFLGFVWVCYCMLGFVVIFVFCLLVWLAILVWVLFSFWFVCLFYFMWLCWLVALIGCGLVYC